MARRWRVSAKSMSGKAIEVYVSQKDWSGDVVAVEAAANMIEWADDDDRDVLLPVRGQSGYLRVVDDGSGEVEKMMPRNNMEHYVEVWRDNKMVFQGYMQAATYTAAWDIAPKVVEFPLIDGLTALESVYMDGTKEMRLTTLGELVHEALKATGVDVMSVVYPKEVRVSESDAAGYAAPWLMEVSRFNFFEKSDAVNYDDPEYQRYDGITYKELLEEVCKLWGWRLVMRGWEALFLSTEADGYVRMPLAGLKNAGTATTEEVAVTSQELAGLDWMSTDHTIERLQGYNKVTVTGVVNAVGDVLPKIEIEGLPFVAEGRGESASEIFGDSGIRERIIQRGAKSGDGTAEVRIYNGWDGEAINPDIINSTEATNERSKGALFVEEDIYNKDDVKRNYEYTAGIRIRVRTTGESSPPTEEESKARPVAILRNFEEAIYQDGAIVLSATTRGIRYGYFGLNGDTYSRLTNGRAMLPLQMRVGGKWWNGSSWQDTAVIFTVRIGLDDNEGSEDGVGKIVNTKTLEMPYEADGYIIPIDQPLQGDTELVLFAPWEIGISDMILIENLKVGYAAINSRKRKHKEGNNRYRAVLNNGFKQKKEVELLMTTSNNNPSAYSVLSYGGGDVNTLLFPGGAMRPEEALLGKLKRNYGGIVEALTVDVADDERTGQLMRLQHGEKAFVVLAESVDLMEERKRVTMVEVND